MNGCESMVYSVPSPLGKPVKPSMGAAQSPPMVRNSEACSAAAPLPPVSVIVPVYNEEALLADALDSVASQDYAGPMEVIVADGSDGPEAAEMIARRFPQFRVLANPQRSTSTALNLAWRAAAYETIVRCDSHSILPPGYIERAVRTLMRTGAANVGGLQVPLGGSTAFARALRLVFNSSLGAGDARYRVGGEEGPVDTVYLGVFRRSALQAVGGFDNRFIRNQDYELNWRLRERGELVWFDPNLTSGYVPRSNFTALARQYFEYGYWKREMLREHPRSLRLRQALVPLLTAGLGLSALQALVGGLFAVFGGAAAGSMLLSSAALLPLGYLLVLLLGSAVLALRRRSAPLLTPLVLIIMHVCWGAGFFAPRQARASAPALPQAPSLPARPLKISIITTVYNDVRIARALDSILNQRHDHELELIVIDAGSDDGTLDVLERYKDRLNVLVSEPDQGIYDGMNKGIRRVSGDVVGILNADDRYADAYVLRDVAAVFQQRPQMRVCYGDLSYVNDHGRMIRYWRSGANRSFKWRLGWRPPHPAFFVRRSVYEEYGLFNMDFAIASDYDLQMRLLLKHHVASFYLNRVLVHMAPGGMSNRSISNVFKANREVAQSWRANRLRGGELVPFLKPLIKAPQFLRRPPPPQYSIQDNQAPAASGLSSLGG